MNNVNTLIVLQDSQRYTEQMQYWVEGDRVTRREFVLGGVAAVGVSALAAGCTVGRGSGVQNREKTMKATIL